MPLPFSNLLAMTSTTPITTAQSSTKIDRLLKDLVKGKDLKSFSKEDLNDQSKAKENTKLRFRDQFEPTPIDTTLYEEKSILWGAVQWTERKNKTVNANTSKNDK